MPPRAVVTPENLSDDFLIVPLRADGPVGLNLNAAHFARNPLTGQISINPSALTVDGVPVPTYINDLSDVDAAPVNGDYLRYNFPLGQWVADEGFTVADSAKLDTIEASATADQTGAEIVAAINGALGSAVWQGGGVEPPTFGRPWLKPAVGEDMLTAENASGMSTAAGSSGKFVMFPFYAPCDISFSQLRIGFSNSIGTGTCKIGVYDSDGNGRPRNLLSETGDISTSTLGFYTGSFAGGAVTLAKGETFWFFARFTSPVNYRIWNALATPGINGGIFTTGVSRTTLLRTLAYSTPTPATWIWDSSEIDDVGGPAILMVRTA